MNLLFVSSDQYPDGGAASNRHMAYAKGLVELNNTVTFILLSHQNKTDTRFIEDGIKFICTASASKRIKKDAIAKLYSTFKSISIAKKEIINLHSNEKLDAIVLLDTYIWELLPFLKLCKNKHIPVLHERTEYPFIVERKGFLGKVHNRIYLSCILPRFDGLYVISLALKKYFLDITRNKIPVSILNMVVDPSRFIFKDISKTDNLKLLVYCGSMDIEKDGIDILVRAFGKAINKSVINEDVKLMLIGDNRDRLVQNKLNQIIEESKCAGKVVFTGLITRQRIPELLNNAHALALARPDNRQAEGGFPTKLGEYLTTGKPVIITDVGEIGLFLKDGDTAFIAQAGSVDSFSEKITQVFDNYPNALRIGSNGRDLVFNEFNYLIQSRRLINFIGDVVLLHSKE